MTKASDAAGGVDGVRTGGFGFHTPLEDGPWWQVDLGGSSPPAGGSSEGEARALRKVLVYNRCAGGAERAFRLHILLSENGKAWRTVYEHDGTPFHGAKDNTPLSVALDGARARFVRIQLPNRGYLHLDEVEVYAEKDEKTNIALGRPADQSSASQWSTASLPPAKPAPAAAKTASVNTATGPDGGHPIADALERARKLVARRRSESVDIDSIAGELEEVASEAEAKAPPADPAAAEARRLYLRARHLVRRLVLADPALDFDQLLFVKRITYSSSHIYTDHFDGSRATGGNLCVLSPLAPDGQVTELVPELSGGIFGRFDLSFDASRIVFAYKRPAVPVGKGYRIYEVGTGGEGLRQLTHDGRDEEEMTREFRHGYDDLDPCYLPDGKIMFASTRVKRTVLCDPRFTVTALHVMDGDGGNVRCLSSNTVNEFTPTVLPDGRVIYTRWEYIDKGCGDVQSLWAMHPDGSHSAHVYKNNVARPATLIDARRIPGSRRFVAVGAPHMPLAVGSVVLVDIGVTQRTSEAMTNITPEIGYPGHSGYPNRAMGYYKEPYPLSEDLFLVAYNPEQSHKAPAGYGIYLLDSEGNRELVYRDPKISCFEPVPLRRRPVPLTVQPVAEAEGRAGGGERANGGEGKATLLMQDVYRGMTGIERGRVRYIRVVEDVPKPWDHAWNSPKLGNCLGLQHPAVSLKGHFAIKRIHGVAKVHEDGSAHFTVPADRNLYFQALDSDYMELQRMRTFVNLMPGERRSCIGCHERRSLAPALGRRPVAAGLAAQDLEPQPGDTGPRAVHYPTDVQPILDRHCVQCHSGPSPKAKLDLTGEPTKLFCRSYENLINRKLVNNIDVTPRSAYIPAEPPLTFGSHRSRMVARLREGPCKVGMDREEFIRLVTWIDTNANYYGTYAGRMNVKDREHPDFRPEPERCAETTR